MNYETLSDFEINKRVAISIGIKPVSYPHNADKRSIGVRHSDSWREWFDYCNNPSDAWTIIMENFISIDQHYNGSYIRVWGYCDAGLISMQCLRKDVLRTAMIVFLKMQEAKRG